MTKEAIILAGGLGTRLRSAVPELPKCMASVAGKPFLYYIISHLKNQGIERFIFAIGYKSNPIIEYIQQSFSNIKHVFSKEDEPLGTGGAIKNACSQVLQKTVLVVNGDTLFSININELIAFHDMCGADCTLSLKPMKHFDRYGVVELNPDYSVRSFKEKKNYESGLINGGVYALHSQRFLEEDLPVKFSFEKDYMEKKFNTNKMYGVIQEKYFIDIGTPEDYNKAQLELKDQIL